MFKSLLLVICLIIPSFSWAAQPKCNTHNGAGYCEYTGKVTRIYINENNLILIYFDVPVDLDHANSFGFGITNDFAAAIDADDKPMFSSLLYATALDAQRTGRNVELQMRGNKAGFLKIDRIWLRAP